MTVGSLSTRAAAVGPVRFRETIQGPVRTADVLGAFPTALYLRVDRRDVMAVLTADAVRLPLGIVLSSSSRALPLTSLTGRVLVGSSVVQVGNWRAHVARLTSVEAPTGLTPRTSALGHLRRGLLRHRIETPNQMLLEALQPDPRSPRTAADTVNGLLGIGPGLTPAGDDLLAGYLVGAWSFGLAVDRLRAATLEASPLRTTALSAALIRCASRGESIPQVNRLLWAMSDSARQNGDLDDALAGLLRVGDTSGAALAMGVLAASRRAIRLLHDGGDATNLFWVGWTTAPQQ